MVAAAEIALEGNQYSKALSAAEKQANLVRSYGLWAYLPEPLYLKGRALLGQERLEEAFETLSIARNKAETLGMRRMSWPILAVMVGIENGRGNAAEVEVLRREGAEIVNYIAGHVANDEHRRSFLTQPKVQAFMASTN